MNGLAALEAAVVECRRCPRLVEWRERVATEKRAAFADWEYWGRPVPGFGDPAARLVIVALGAFGWEAALRLLAPGLRPKPRFGHGAEAEVGPYRLLGSFHPSQQNTFTGKLTREMLDGVFSRAIAIADPRG